MPPSAVPSRRLALLATRVALVALLASALSAVGGVRAAMGDATIPDEVGAIRLDGPSYSTLVADLDGDGVRELVRVTTTGGDGTGLGVEVWRQAKDGSWDLTAPAVELRRAAAPGDRLKGIVDKDGTLPAKVGDGVRLLLWHQGSRERALAVVNGTDPTSSAFCCLTVWEVTEPAAGGPPRLRLLANTQLGGDTVFAADMNGDGTDELAVYESGGQNTRASFDVMGWSAGRFSLVTSQPLNAGDNPQAFVLGNTDGLPGDEIGFIGSFGGGDPLGYGLSRVSLRGAAIHVETAELPSDGVVIPVPGGASAGSNLVFGAVDKPLLALSWPADEDTIEVARSSKPGVPVCAIGHGVNLRILVRTDPQPTLELMRPDLDAGSTEVLAPSHAATPFLTKSYQPYAGPWPDLLSGGEQAVITQGVLLRADSGAAISEEPMAVLPGMAPIGQLGVDQAWTALEMRARSTPAPSEVASNGGLLLVAADSSITLARTADVLAPEVGGGSIRPAVQDAFVDARASTAAQQALVTATPAFEATITAPPDSVAMVIMVNSAAVYALVRNVPPAAQSEIGGPPFRIPVVSSLGSPGNQVFEATLLVLTPAGHAYSARWHVRLLRAPPRITADPAFFSLGPGATLDGRTDPSATITAEGQTVHAGPDGRFELQVPAGVIPRDVVLEARDAVGNRGSITVSVLAPLDYRRLPWLPIVALITVAAGAFLFLQAPRRMRKPVSAAVTTEILDDATLEELDPD